MKDKYIENLWIELEDIPFIETDYQLVLDVDFYIFRKGTTVEDIWSWFDKHHSKGVAWLMYEFKER